MIFTVGTVLMFIFPLNVKATYGLTVKTVDGETISFNVFEPKNGGNNKKAIILGHGIMSNKEMLKGYAIELAAAGFVAVPFDFRGHGQSSGELKRDLLTNDIDAIVSYLDGRPDINSSSLGYFGFSMGGFPGIQVVNKSTNFKCFIGAATWLPNNIRKGNSSSPLNILMILGRYDELLDPIDLKEGISNYTNIPISELDVNRLYGSFQDGNAAMIYLDDNSNHALGDWDPDFIRETRNFVMNTFPDVKPVDENFYANIRLINLFLQLMGGFGLFALLVDLLSNLILKRREEESFKIELENETFYSISGRAFGYSLILGLPGIILFIPIILVGYLATAGFILALLFGQAFGILIFLWRIGKKNNLSLGEILKKPFKIPRGSLLRQIILGITSAVILSIIIYLSAGLNYIGMIPSLIKIVWFPLYFGFVLLIFLIFGIMFQGILQNKLDEGLKQFTKVSLMIFSLLFMYMFIYLLIISLLMGSFFYFGSFLPFALPLLLMNSFVFTYIYKKSGNIFAGVITNALFFTLFICTISPLQSGFSFIMGFFS